MENNILSIQEIFQNDSISHSPNNCQVIEKIHGEDLIKSDKHLLFRGLPVHPEFRNLVKIPLDIFTTIRDPFPTFRQPTEEKAREDYCKKLAGNLNAWLLEKHQGLPTHSKTARFVRVNEYGNSLGQVHVHLLWHINENAPEGIATEILEYLNVLEPKTFRGVRCFDNQMIYDKLGVVSYVCKIEAGRQFKKFCWSPFFWKVCHRKIRQGVWC